jgi:hypothetical protein
MSPSDQDKTLWRYKILPYDDARPSFHGIIEHVKPKRNLEGGGYGNHGPPNSAGFPVGFRKYDSTRRRPHLGLKAFAAPLRVTPNLPVVMGSFFVKSRSGKSSTSSIHGEPENERTPRARLPVIMNRKIVERESWRLFWKFEDRKRPACRPDGHGRRAPKQVPRLLLTPAASWQDKVCAKSVQPAEGPLMRPHFIDSSFSSLS